MGDPTPESAAIDAATDQEMAYAQGRDEERAAVVAWLRRRSVDAPDWRRLSAIATTLERGEHRKNPS